MRFLKSLFGLSNPEGERSFTPETMGAFLRLSCQSCPWFAQTQIDGDVNQDVNAFPDSLLQEANLHWQTSQGEGNQSLFEGPTQSFGGEKHSHFMVSLAQAADSITAVIPDNVAIVYFDEKGNLQTSKVYFSDQ